jgi:hypothetical protein
LANCSKGDICTLLEIDPLYLAECPVPGIYNKNDIINLQQYCIMDIPHEVEELILAFVGLKRRNRCIAQTKQNKICSRKTGNNWILCHQHMKQVNQLIDNPKSISPRFVNLCLIIHQAMLNSEAYRRKKEKQKRTKGKTYYPYANRFNYLIEYVPQNTSVNHIIRLH